MIETHGELLFSLNPRPQGKRVEKCIFPLMGLDLEDKRYARIKPSLQSQGFFTYLSRFCSISKLRRINVIENINNLGSILFFVMR
jgi:hypothetical protein